jgi:hypothetical protein
VVKYSARPFSPNIEKVALMISVVPVKLRAKLVLKLADACGWTIDTVVR